MAQDAGEVKQISKLTLDEVNEIYKTYAQVSDNAFATHDLIPFELTTATSTVELSYVKKKAIKPDFFRDDNWAKLPEVGLLGFQRAVMARYVTDLVTTVEIPKRAAMVSKKVVISHLILDATSTWNISHNMQYCKLFRVAPKGTLLVTDILAILSWVDGLQDITPMYLMRPDISVQVTNNVNEYNQVKVINNYEIIDADARKDGVALWTTAEMTATAYVLMLAMVKPISDWGYFTKYAQKRIESMSFQIGAEGIQTSTYDVSATFEEADLKSLAKNIGFFPNLKSMIFNMVISSEKTIIPHMRMIFAESSITMFTFIHKFICAEEPTLLHVHLPLIQPTIRWARKLAELKKTFGNDWVYYKLLCPNGQLTSVKEYQILADAAVAWLISVTDPEKSTLSKLKGYRENKHFRTLASKPLPNKHRKIKEGAQIMDLSEALKREMEELGVMDMSNVGWATLVDLVDRGEIEI